MKKFLILILIVVTLSCTICSCEKQDPEEYSWIDLEGHSMMCKIVPTQTELPLQEDIVITIAYGWLGLQSRNSDEDNTLLLEDRIQRVTMYAYNTNANATQQDWDNETYIKTIEDFCLLKYKITPSVEPIYNKNKEQVGNKWTRFEFSYAEEFVIPKNLLEDEIGYVLIYILGEGMSETLCAIDVFKYKKSDDSITITEITYDSKEYKDVEFIVKEK